MIAKKITSPYISATTTSPFKSPLLLSSEVTANSKTALLFKTLGRTVAAPAVAVCLFRERNTFLKTLLTQPDEQATVAAEHQPTSQTGVFLCEEVTSID